MKRSTTGFFLSVFLLLAALSVYPATVIFPFKISSSGSKAHQWLGRGISLYLSLGLESNHIDTFPENEGRGVLRSLNIKFPYNISKASIIRAARLMRADELIWGEISVSGGDHGENLSVRTSVINLGTLEQKLVSGINGKVTDLFSIQKEILKKLTAHFAGDDLTPVLPDMGFDLRHYETFIKSLIVDDNEKKIRLLGNIRSELDTVPEILLFELAGAYLVTGDLESAKEALKQIGTAGMLEGEKNFLSGMIHYFSNDVDVSLENFLKVLETGEYRDEVLNNLSLVYVLKGEYSKAYEAVNESVSSGMAPDSFLNAVNISLLQKDRESALAFLRKGLALYPSDEQLILLFLSLLEDSPFKDRIKPAFLKFLPGINPERVEKKMFFKMINPFVFSPQKYNMELGDTEEEISGLNEARDNDDAEEAEKRLIFNPFLPEDHTKLALSLLKQKKYNEALRYGHAALYLVRKPENFITVLTILREQGDREALKEMLIEALKYFPDNSELKNFSLDN